MAEGFNSDPETQKREMERTQLMIALYLGIGITVFLIIVGICVECMKKRYYEDKADLDSSLESGSIDQTKES
jgi:hypothetical protein